jgi:mRNA interferase RelE/StbE
MAWTIEFERAAERDFSKIDESERRRILHFLDSRVSKLKNPREIGEPLHGPKLGRYWKYRVGAYRIIVDIRDERMLILVVNVGHRREVYR